MSESDAKSWRELKAGFNWERTYLQTHLKMYRRAEEKWDHLHTYVPQLFPLIKNLKTEGLFARIGETPLEDIRQILKPFTNDVLMGVSADGTLCCEFKLTIAGRSLTLTLHLPDTYKTRRES